jgi:hypothetical protein
MKDFDLLLYLSKYGTIQSCNLPLTTYALGLTAEGWTPEKIER